MIFKHNIKIAWRNLMKYKLQTLVSIVSLAIGMYLFSVAGVLLLDDYQYDRNYPDTENTYLIRDKENRDYHKCYPKCEDYIRENCPEVEAITVFDYNISLNLTDKRFAFYIDGGGDTIHSNQISVYTIDDSFQDIYGIKVIEGRKRLNLKRGEIAISQELASERFPDGDALGQVLRCEKDIDRTDSLYKVVAIFKDRQNETIAPKALTGGKLGVDFVRQIMVRIKPGTFDSFEKKLNNLVTYFDDAKNIKFDYPYTAINVLDMHGDYLNSQNYTLHYSYMRLFLLLAIIIITCALFNYIIMLIARINIRQRELALRYVNGAKTSQLVWLIVTEMIIILGIAYFLASIFDSHNGSMYDRGIFFTSDFDTHRGAFRLFAFFVIAVSIIVTSFVVACCNKKQLNVSITKKSGAVVKSWIYRLNVGVQFLLSLSAIFATYTLSNQLDYWKTSQELGQDFENVYGISKYRVMESTSPDDFKDSLFIFLDSVRNQPCVEKAGLCVRSRCRECIKYNGNDCDPEIYGVTEDAFDIMHFQLVKGRFINDTDTDKVVVTENVMGDQIKAKLGDTIEFQGSKKTVVGIVKNIYEAPNVYDYPRIFASAYSNLLRPYYGSEFRTYRCVINLKQGYNEEDLSKLIFDDSDKRSAKHPLKNSSYDSSSSQLEFQLTSEYSMLTFLRFMVFASVLLAISGVYGIVSLSCERRRKEIAIRQIHGAKFASILRLFLSEYVYMLLASAVIVFPIGYYLANKWASEYVKQAPIQWWVYPSIFLSLALVIFISVFWQIYKTASANPADVMKNE